MNLGDPIESALAVDLISLTSTSSSDESVCSILITFDLFATASGITSTITSGVVDLISGGSDLTLVLQMANGRQLLLKGSICEVIDIDSLPDWDCFLAEIVVHQRFSTFSDDR